MRSEEQETKSTPTDTEEGLDFLNLNSYSSSLQLIQHLYEENISVLEEVTNHLQDTIAKSNQRNYEKGNEIKLEVIIAAVKQKIENLQNETHKVISSINDCSKNLDSIKDRLTVMQNVLNDKTDEDTITDEVDIDKGNAIL